MNVMNYKNLSPEEIMRDLVDRGLVDEDISPQDLEPRFEVSSQIANELIPRLPRVGMFSTKKGRVAAYRKTRKMVHSICRRKGLDKKHEAAVLFILLNRSKSYSRALHGHFDSFSDKIVYPEGRFREEWPYFVGLLLVGIIMFARGDFNDLQKLAAYILLWLIFLFV